MLLDVVEWRILSYLAVMNVWRGVTAEMVGGALALHENDLNETLQRLKEQSNCSSRKRERGPCENESVLSLGLDAVRISCLGFSGAR